MKVQQSYGVQWWEPWFSQH